MDERSENDKRLRSSGEYMFVVRLCICSVTDLSVFVLTATDTTTEKISGSGFHLSLFNETPERKNRRMIWAVGTGVLYCAVDFRGWYHYSIMLFIKTSVRK